MIRYLGCISVRFYMPEPMTTAAAAGIAVKLAEKFASKVSDKITERAASKLVTNLEQHSTGEFSEETRQQLTGVVANPDTPTERIADMLAKNTSEDVMHTVHSKVENGQLNL